MSERLQKFLARAGVASRRHAEGLIIAGRVTVNNQTVTTLGTKVEPGDLVTVDGALVSPPERSSWYLLHKPPGVMTTLADPEGRPTVAGFLDEVQGRVFPVGRLDWDAEGALLFTNDGGAAHRLLHPSFEVPRTYLAKVKGTPTDETLQRLVDGVRLEDGPARALKAARFEAAERNTWIEIQVGEGRPHLVKRLCAAVGHPVLRLFRPAQASVSVAGLAPGAVRPLSAEEVRRVEAIAAGEALPPVELFLPPRRHGRSGEEDQEFDGTPGAVEPVVAKDRGTGRAMRRADASAQGRGGASDRRDTERRSRPPGRRAGAPGGAGFTRPRADARRGEGGPPSPPPERSRRWGAHTTDARGPDGEGRAEGGSGRGAPGDRWKGGARARGGPEGRSERGAGSRSPPGDRRKAGGRARGAPGDRWKGGGGARDPRGDRWGSGGRGRDGMGAERRRPAGRSGDRPSFGARGATERRSGDEPAGRPGAGRFGARSGRLGNARGGAGEPRSFSPERGQRPRRLGGRPGGPAGRPKRGSPTPGSRWTGPRGGGGGGRGRGGGARRR